MMGKIPLELDKLDDSILLTFSGTARVCCVTRQTIYDWTDGSEYEPILPFYWIGKRRKIRVGDLKELIRKGPPSKRFKKIGKLSQELPAEK